jgi:hypothetical protein
LDGYNGGQANLIFPQIANLQILGLILLSQIHKYLLSDSQQIANPQIFMINQQIANPQFSPK